jgi:hypothetical protein
MKNPHHRPTYLRYFRARLLNLARPSFWGTAIFLLVIGFVIKHYWNHPDLLTHTYNNQQTPAEINSNLSDEDRAIAADIDNLPVLFKEINQDAVVPATTIDKTQVKKNKTLLDELNNKQQEQNKSNQSKLSQNTGKSSSKIKIQNPFVLQAESLLQANQGQANQTDNTGLLNSEGIGNSSPNLGLGFNNSNSKNTNTQGLSPLQYALNQSKNPNSSSLKKIGFSENSLQTPDKNLQNSLTQTNSLTSYPSQQISAFPGNNFGQLGNTNFTNAISINTASTLTQPNIPTTNFETATSTYNSQTYNQPQTYNSPTSNSPTYNQTQTYNSQTYSQPQAYDIPNTSNYNVNQIPSGVISTPAPITSTSSIPTNTYTSNPTVLPSKNYTSPSSATSGAVQQYNSFPNAVQYPGVGQ